MKLRRWLWPLLITFLAASVRWHRLEDIGTSWDHTFPIAQAQYLLSKGEWPVLGQKTTFLFSNPPLQAYVTLIPLTIFQSSWGIYWFMTAMNILAVPLLYHLGRELFTETEALTAAFLFAVSPWVILYSRVASSGALKPFLTALTLALLAPVLSARHPHQHSRRLLAGLVTATVLTQTYLLALLVTPVQVGLMLLLRLRQIPWRTVLLGGLIFATCTGVYAFHILQDWPTQSARLGSFIRTGNPFEFKVQALRIAARYVTGHNFEAPSAPGIVSGLYQASNWLIAAALITGIVLALSRSLRRSPEALANAILLIWWVTPIAALSINQHPLHNWHLVLSLPAGHLLAARGIGFGLKFWDRLKPITAFSSIILAMTTFVVFNAGNLSNAARPAPADLDLITLGTSRRLGATLQQLVDKHQVTEGYANLPDTDLTAWSHRPLATVSWFIDSDLLILPQNRPAIYIRLGHGGPPKPFVLARREETLIFPGNDFVAFDVFPALDRSAAAALPEIRVDWPSETGLTLLGYTLNDSIRSGHIVTMTVYLLIESLPETRINYIYQPYLHLNASDGSTLLNTGGLGLPGHHYREGDLYIQPLILDLPATIPPGEYQLELGLYDGLHAMGTTFYPLNDAPRPFYTTSAIIR